MKVEERESTERSPSEYSDDELRVEALRWVNDVRGEYGLPPIEALPSGIRYYAGGCVLANALRDIVDESTSCSTSCPSEGRCSFGPPTLRFARDGAVQSRPVPAAINEFAKRFDAGRYPDLAESDYGSVLGPYVLARG